MNRVAWRASFGGRDVDEVDVADETGVLPALGSSRSGVDLYLGDHVLRARRWGIVQGGAGVFIGLPGDDDLQLARADLPDAGFAAHQRGGDVLAPAFGVVGGLLLEVAGAAGLAVLGQGCGRGREGGSRRIRIRRNGCRMSWIRSGLRARGVELNAFAQFADEPDGDGAGVGGARFDQHARLHGGQPEHAQCQNDEGHQRLDERKTALFGGMKGFHDGVSCCNP